MRIRYIPAVSSLTLLTIFVGLWFYAFYVTGNTPLLMRWLIMLSVIGVSLVGIGATVTLKETATLKTLYVVGVISILAGVVSFYIFTAPATINIFGFIAILLGMIVALVTSVIIAAQDRDER